MQGGHDGNLITSKKHVGLFEPFCRTMVPLLIKNIQLQLEGGAEVIMLFDTAAGELSPAMYEKHVIPQLKKMVAVYPKKLGYYSKMTSAEHLRDPLFTGGQFAGLGVDHRWDMGELLKKNDRWFLPRAISIRPFCFKSPKISRSHYPFTLSRLKISPRRRGQGGFVD